MAMAASGEWTFPTYPNLAGKVALVTGGSRGIGAATCRALAANGVRVAVNGRDQAAIDATVDRITTAGGEAIGVAADCTDVAAIERMRGQVEQAFGPVDVLMAFVGGLGNSMPTVEVSPEQWRAVIDANLTATFLTVRSFLPGMIDRRRGVILTMSSSAGRVGRGQAAAAYAAAKAGVVMFTEHLAREVGQYGIRLNCLAPSAVLTETSGLNRVPEEVRRQLAASFPLGRIGTPEDVAEAALFLASDSSSWITGLTLDLAGGRAGG
jgi:3-oxoacyl-[acyl-carrier protein] reductase